MVLFMILLLCISVDAKVYHVGDKVEVLVNKIGPYANKHETYHYYQLPLCRPFVIVHRSLSLGQLLNGDRMAESPYLLHFGKQRGKTSICGRYKLTSKDLDDLIAAVEDNFYLELIVDPGKFQRTNWALLCDNIRVHNYLGFIEEQNTFPHMHRTYLYTHFIFTIAYDKGTGEVRLIKFSKTYLRRHFESVSSSGAMIYIELSSKQTTTRFLILVRNLITSNFFTVLFGLKRRKKLERQNSFDEEFFALQAEQVQWMAILNSSLLVMLLVSLVAWILRYVIKSDLNRYNGKTITDFVFESGWKSISADVFRLPKFCILFASVIGVGSQFLLLITLVMIIGSTSLISPRNHEVLNSVAVLLYAVTSGVAGFTSAYIYRQFGEKNWIVNANVTTSLFAVPMILIWMLNNSVSWAYGSTQALPYTTVAVLGLFWLFVGYPLTVVGAAVGKNFAAPYSTPCHTRNIPRELPALPFYKTNFVLMLFGGFLSFSAMSVELYYIFSTIWGRESYTIYYVLLIAFLIMITVVATSSITLIYVKLSAEDYRWWWLSIFIGGQIDLYICLLLWHILLHISLGYVWLTANHKIDCILASHMHVLFIFVVVVSTQE
uniref:Transmembrane 9 superfamily member n=1 Tax=Elaeophora elaphi TaxID=1147741 RepID=A0A0R3RF87_9BILA